MAASGPIAGLAARDGGGSRCPTTAVHRCAKCDLL